MAGQGDLRHIWPPRGPPLHNSCCQEMVTWTVSQLLPAPAFWGSPRATTGLSTDQAQGGLHLLAAWSG